MKFLAFLLACPNQKRHVQNNLNVKKKKIQTNERKKANRPLVFQPWCLTPVTIVTKSQREVNYLEGTPLCRDQAEIQTTQHGSGTTYSVNAKQYRVPAVKESE